MQIHLNSKKVKFAYGMVIGQLTKYSVSWLKSIVNQKSGQLHMFGSYKIIA